MPTALNILVCLHVKPSTYQVETSKTSLKYHFALHTIEWFTCICGFLKEFVRENKKSIGKMMLEMEISKSFMRMHLGKGPPINGY